MQILVKTLIGKTIKEFIVEIEPDQTIYELKMAIEDKINIPVKDQRIIFAGKACNNTLKVGFSDLQIENNVHLMVVPYELQKKSNTPVDLADKSLSVEVTQAKQSKILVFDVSETLQTAKQESDGFAIKETVDFGDFSLPSYSTLIGGKKTADLLNAAKDQGIKIYIATHNGGNTAINTELEFRKFLKSYGFDLDEGHYCSNITPGVKARLNGKDCEKYIILDYICEKEKVSKDQVLFFDDSSNNVKLARENGYEAVEVRSHVDNAHKAAIADLHEGIKGALTSCSKMANTNRNSFFTTNDSSKHLEGSKGEALAEILLNKLITSYRLNLFDVANVHYWQVTGGTNIQIDGKGYQVPKLVAEIHQFLFLSSIFTAAEKMRLICRLAEKESNQFAADSINKFKPLWAGDPLMALRKDTFAFRELLNDEKQTQTIESTLHS